MREMNPDSEIDLIGSISFNLVGSLLRLSLPEERSHHDEHPHPEVAVDVVLRRVEHGDDGADEDPVEGGDAGARQVHGLHFQ